VASPFRKPLLFSPTQLRVLSQQLTTQCQQNNRDPARKICYKHACYLLGEELERDARERRSASLWMLKLLFGFSTDELLRCLRVKTESRPTKDGPMSAMETYRHRGQVAISEVATICCLLHLQQRSHRLHTVPEIL